MELASEENRARVTKAGNHRISGCPETIVLILKIPECRKKLLPKVKNKNATAQSKQTGLSDPIELSVRQIDFRKICFLNQQSINQEQYIKTHEITGRLIPQEIGERQERADRLKSINDTMRLENFPRQ